MPEFNSFDGTRIHYLDEGEGHPVLLLHGFSSSGKGSFGPWAYARSVFERALGPGALPDAPAETAAGIISRLRDIGARIVAPDMRGHGASETPVDPKAYADRAMARDVAALLDHLGITQVDVFGYSMGSITALKLLWLGDKRVRSAILGGMGPGLCVAGRFMPDTPGMDDAYPPELKKPITNKAYCEYAAEVMLGDKPASGIPGQQMKFIDAMGLSRVAAAAILRNDLGVGVPPEALAGVSIPVLVLNGDNDLQKPDERGFADVLSNVCFGSARGDHLTALIDPDYQRGVLEFLQWRWGGGTQVSTRVSQSNA